ncbi:MAG TPA: hypothetical protein VMT69_17015, partial [Kineosporiaceae bacterium]|nr:hypothetical protein [Kineosporiaceae bacterium]
MSEPDWPEVGEPPGDVLHWLREDRSWEDRPPEHRSPGEWSPAAGPPAGRSAAQAASGWSQQPPMAPVLPATRRQLREARATGHPVGPQDAGSALLAPPAWAAGAQPEAAQPAGRGPSTPELQVYRASPADPGQAAPDHLYPGAAVDLPPVATDEESTGGFRGGVERWSRWAAGLGLPPRDGAGVRRYPARER